MSLQDFMLDKNLFVSKQRLKTRSSFQAVALRSGSCLKSLMSYNLFNFRCRVVCANLISKFKVF
jgi:hypothetical protein